MKPIISCQFNMDTTCVDLMFLDGTVLSIDTIAVEDEVAANMYERSEFGNSIGVAKAYESRSQRTGRIYYPWWENAARAVESRSSLLAVLLILLAVYLVIYSIVFGVRYRKQGAGMLKDRISKRKESSHGHAKHK